MQRMVFLTLFLAIFFSELSSGTLLECDGNPNNGTDFYVNSAGSNNNYGDGAAGHTLSFGFVAGEQRRAYVNATYCLASLPAGVTFTNVIFGFFDTNAGIYGDPNLTIYGLNHDVARACQESTCTWNNCAGGTGCNSLINYSQVASIEVGPYGANIGTNASLNITWAQNIFNTGKDLHFLLKGASSGANNAEYAGQREDATVNFRWKLYFNYSGEGGNNPPSAPSFALPTPPTNELNNTNKTINLTATGSDLRFWLWFGTAPLDNQDELMVNNGTGVSMSGNQLYYNWTMNLSTDGDYTFTAGVQNTTSGLFSTNTSRTFTLDTSKPSITLQPNSNLSAANTTIISPYLQNLSINFSFADPNLFQVLLNLTNGSGIWDYLNTSLGGAKTVNYSTSIYLGNFSLGNYTFKTLATDSHTKNKIGDYKINRGFYSIRYRTQEGNDITIEADSATWLVDTEKKEDRYEFNFDFILSKPEYKFLITSDHKLTYLEDSEYKGHFVSITSEGQGNWLDFENEYLSRGDYSVKQIDDRIFELTITSNGMKKFKFRSLGGVNLQEKHYILKIGGVADFFVNNSQTNKPINFTLTIDGNTVVQGGNETGARAVNLTRGEHSLVFSSAGLTNFSTSINTTLQYVNYSYLMYPTNSVIGKIYNEDNNLTITEELTVVYKKGNVSNSTKTTTGDLLLYGIPVGLWNIKIYGTNWPLREYFATVTNSSNTNLNAYMLNTTFSSKTLNVLTGAGDPIETANLTFLRDIQGSVGVTVGQKQTDFAGQAIITLDQFTRYTILISAGGYPLKSIELEPTSSSYDIVLSAADGGFQNPFGDISYTTSPTTESRNLTTNHLNLSILYASGNSNLEFFGMMVNSSFNCTPTPCKTNSTGSPAGGLSFLTIIPNETGTAAVTYFFKPLGEPSYTFTKNYLFTGYIPPSDYSFVKTTEVYGKSFSTAGKTIFAVMGTTALVGTAAEIGIFGLPLILVTILGLGYFAIVGWLSKVIVGLCIIIGLAVFAVFSRGESS